VDDRVQHAREATVQIIPVRTLCSGHRSTLAL